MMAKSTAVSAAAAVLLLLLGCPHEQLGATSLVATAQAAEAAPEEPGLSIYMFTLGQADSMLVLGPPPQRRSLLIDLGSARGGDRKNHRRIADRIEQLSGRREVDYFLVSHFHADHMGTAPKGKGKPKGMFGLLNDPEEPFKIGTWMDRGDDGEEYAPRTKPHQNLLEHIDGWIAAGRVGKRVVPQIGSDSIDLGPGVVVEVLSVAGRRADGESALARVEAEKPGTYAEAPASENDFSIALLIRRGDFELFTAGDLTGAAWPGEGEAYPTTTHRNFGRKSSTYTNVEAWLVRDWQARGREMDVEIYRANHHGSAYSSTQELLGVLDPEFILYSCGGWYGHPAPEVVRRGAKTARQFITYAAALSSWPGGLPAELGTIVGEVPIEVAADGRSYTISGEQQPAYSDKDEAAGKDLRP
jgi:hypothetical protein